MPLKVVHKKLIVTSNDCTLHTVPTDVSQMMFYDDYTVNPDIQLPFSG